MQITPRNSSLRAPLRCALCRHAAGQLSVTSCRSCEVVVHTDCAFEFAPLVCPTPGCHTSWASEPSESVTTRAIWDALVSPPESSGPRPLEPLREAFRGLRSLSKWSEGLILAGLMGAFMSAVTFVYAWTYSQGAYQGTTQQFVEQLQADAQPVIRASGLVFLLSLAVIAWGYLRGESKASQPTDSETDSETGSAAASPSESGSANPCSSDNGVRARDITSPER